MGELAFAITDMLVIVTHLAPAIQIEFVNSMWLYFPRMWFIIHKTSRPSLNNFKAFGNLLIH